MSVGSEIKSFLSKIGHAFSTAEKDVQKYAPVVITYAEKVESTAEPVLTLAFPGVAPGIIAATKTALSAVVSVEQKFTTAGAPTGTGPQKLAEVTSIVGPVLAQALQAEGLKSDPATITAWINAIVGFLNGIPAGQVATTA